MSDWCEALGIERPDLAAVVDHPDANTYTRLIVSLLERGEPMTLDEVARRFEEVGVGTYERVLLSLKRCKPARPPVYRDGEHYSLDPHDGELALWVFRLGLEPPLVPELRVVRSEPPPLPDDDVRLSVTELDEAWRDASLGAMSSRRLALAVLDAHDGPMRPTDIASFIDQRTRHHRFDATKEPYARNGRVVAVEADGRWSIVPDIEEDLRSMRRAVRAQLKSARLRADRGPNPVIAAARRAAVERERRENVEQLARLSRALLVGFPTKAPRAVALLDVRGHAIETFVDEELERLRERVASFDLLGAENVRGLLRALDIGAEGKRLAELGPPQKRMTIDQRGRTLAITNTLLVQGSCGISRPFGDAKKLRGYLKRGESTKLRRRLAADAKSLYALYEYGRLHGTVRLRWGFLDTLLVARWVHRDEPTLHDLKRSALESGRALEIVAGSAPGWAEPWSRARRARVVGAPPRDFLGGPAIVDATGMVDDHDIQRARLLPPETV